ncbi:unnamed protein product [Darwinula stevensoni]|uniref:Ig-like domain-containing protein n=1 Tax=Darwinula stevensoni TaxID=69355 RepID=A0A7R9A7L3_9CRUS|nr:unnamed protein product [Darwinula stevensoni]CAG0893923.1 unnamed protein product [Darwinula stevensoni]
MNVSWIRQKDLHVLSSGLNKYTQDDRIQVLHKNGTETWNLKIRDAIESDSGVYECQVNTEPKISSSVTLNVTGDAKLADVIRCLEICSGADAKKACAVMFMDSSA